LNYFVFDYVKGNPNEFKLVKFRNKDYVLAFTYIDDNVVIKQCLNTEGISLYTVQDKHLEDNAIIRKSGNIETLFDKGKNIISVKKDIKFNSIFTTF
jgi:hypothetical protein